MRQARPINVDDIYLEHGSHYGVDSMLANGRTHLGSDGQPAPVLCAMEAVAYLADEKHSAGPSCASQVIIAFVIRLNDGASDEDRQRLKPYLIRIATSGWKTAEMMGLDIAEYRHWEDQRRYLYHAFLLFAKRGPGIVCGCGACNFSFDAGLEYLEKMLLVGTQLVVVTVCAPDCSACRQAAAPNYFKVTQLAAKYNATMAAIKVPALI